MKKILKGIGILLLILAIGAGGLAWYAKTHEKQIIDFAKKELEKHLITDVRFSEASFSLLEHFPNASISFEDVLIYDTQKEPDTLLHAKKFALEFDIVDIIKEDYKVKSLGVWNGETNLIREKDGKVNYVFWKETASENESMSFGLENAHMHQIKFKLQDAPADLFLKVNVDDLALSGGLDGEVLDLDLAIDADYALVEVDEVAWLKGLPVNGEVKMVIDLENERYTFEKSQLHILGIPLEGRGSFENTPEAVLCAFEASGNHLDLEKLLLALPEEVSDPLTAYQIEGDADVQVTISGAAGNQQKPKVDVIAEVKDGSLEHKHSGSSIQRIHSNVDYHFSDKETLNLKNFRARIAGADISGDAYLEDLSSPIIQANLRGGASLAELQKLFFNDHPVRFSGDTKFNLACEGRLPNWKISTDDLKFNGDVQWDLGEIQVPDLAPIQASLIAKASNAVVALERLSLDGPNSDLMISGEVKDLLGYIQNERDIDLNLKVLSQAIDMQDFLTPSESGTISEFQWPERMSGGITVHSNRIQHDAFVAEEVKGKVNFREGFLAANDIRMKTMKGVITGSAELNENGELLLFSSDLNGQAIDVHKLFNSFQNFGQDFLIADHVKGKCSADANVRFTMTKTMDVDTKSIIAKAKMKIEDGELIELDQMGEICEYLRENNLISSMVDANQLEASLKHVYFEELSNEIEIEDSRIRVPKMDIASSAMDISIEGEHGFDQSIDYSMGFYLRDLWKEGKQNDYGEVEDDGLGNRFFLRMTGTTDNPEFGYDRLAHKQQRREDLQREKQVLRTILKEDLNPFKRKKKEEENSKESEGIVVSVSQPDEPEQEEEEKKGLKGLFSKKNKKKESENIDLDEDDDDF